MRVERDSLGDCPVPDDALYGASTERARRHLHISGHLVPAGLVSAVGLIKQSAAAANEQLGRLSAERCAWIQRVAAEVVDGSLAAHFPLDVFQTGSGTSTHTNVNEVIANRASQQAGRPLGSHDPIHPNDHVNLGQSSNDVMPSALHISVALALHHDLGPALVELAGALDNKAVQFKDVVKVGRTHLMDATPMTLGQECSGWAQQVWKARDRVIRARQSLMELAVGGTAVGTGINGHPDFARLVCHRLAESTGLPFREATNHFEAQAARDDCAEVAGHLAAVAAALTKIANDIRLLGSGPRAGLAELRLPAVHPGSSIMPGKVNPIMCEMLVQVGLYVQGLTQTAMLCARDGHLELNATIPLIAHALNESIVCLSRGVRAFTWGCITGLEADPDRCAQLVGQATMLVTALTPMIGYDRAAAIAGEAFRTGQTIKAVAASHGVMDPDELDRVLDPAGMLAPKR